MRKSLKITLWTAGVVVALPVLTLTTLQQLGVDRYVLMGHSIAGIYALEYSELYPDELVAFVGIDSSVPDQPGWDDPVPTDGLSELRTLGLLRVLSAIGGDTYAGMPYDEDTKEQMRLLTTKNSTAPTLLDEMDHAPEHFASVSGTTFLSTPPVLLFVAQDDSDVDGWLELHEDQAASVDRGEVVPLEGEHYLHHTQSPQIAHGTVRNHLSSAMAKLHADPRITAAATAHDRGWV